MKSHIIGFLLVTLAKIPMPIKIGTTFQNKLRPIPPLSPDHTLSSTATSREGYTYKIAALLTVSARETGRVVLQWNKVKSR